MITRADIGKKFLLRQVAGDPFPQVSRVEVVILDVLAGWVRYAHTSALQNGGTIGRDERCRETIFEGVFYPVEAVEKANARN